MGSFPSWSLVCLLHTCPTHIRSSPSGTLRAWGTEVIKQEVLPQNDEYQVRSCRESSLKRSQGKLPRGSKISAEIRRVTEANEMRWGERGSFGAKIIHTGECWAANNVTAMSQALQYWEEEGMGRDEFGDFGRGPHKPLEPGKTCKPPERAPSQDQRVFLVLASISQTCLQHKDHCLLLL